MVARRRDSASPWPSSCTLGRPRPSSCQSRTCAILSASVSLCPTVAVASPRSAPSPLRPARDDSLLPFFDVPLLPGRNVQSPTPRTSIFARGGPCRRATTRRNRPSEPDCGPTGTSSRRSPARSASQSSPFSPPRSPSSSLPTPSCPSRPSCASSPAWARPTTRRPCPPSLTRSTSPQRRRATSGPTSRALCAPQTRTRRRRSSARTSTSSRAPSLLNHGSASRPHAFAPHSRASSSRPADALYDRPAPHAAHLERPPHPPSRDSFTSRPLLTNVPLAAPPPAFVTPPPDQFIQRACRSGGCVEGCPPTDVLGLVGLGSAAAHGESKQVDKSLRSLCEDLPGLLKDLQKETDGACRRPSTRHLASPSPRR